MARPRAVPCRRCHTKATSVMITVGLKRSTCRILEFRPAQHMSENENATPDDERMDVLVRRHVTRAWSMSSACVTHVGTFCRGPDVHDHGYGWVVPRTTAHQARAHMGWPHAHVLTSKSDHTRTLPSTVPVCLEGHERGAVGYSRHALADGMVGRSRAHLFVGSPLTERRVESDSAVTVSSRCCCRPSAACCSAVELT